MIPSAWNPKRSRQDAESRNDGDSEAVVRDLGDLVGSYYIESAQVAGEFAARRLYHDALELDAVRIGFVAGHVTLETAQAYLAAGTLRLSRLRREGHEIA